MLAFLLRRQLFGLRFAVELTNTTDPSEPKQLTTETALKLQAHIDGETRFLNQSLDTALGGTISKRSALTNLECTYSRVTLLVDFRFLSP